MHLKTLVLSTLIFLTALALPTQVAAQTGEWGGVCVGGEITGGGDVATIQGLQCLLGNFLTVILALIGMAALVMLIIGGFRWMLSGSNPKGAEQAKNTITFAVIGIVVALSGFIILNLIASFTGLQEITTFTIPGSDTP